MKMKTDIIHEGFFYLLSSMLLVLLLSPTLEGAAVSNFKCSSGKFKCASQEKCIPQTWTCDGDDDCGDNSDEASCKVKECKLDTHFSCVKDNKCIPLK